MLAGSQTSPCEASRQMADTASNCIPNIAAIAPVSTGTASCMYLPRLRTARTPGGDRDSQDCGLRVFGQSKLIVGTFVAELGKFQA